MGRINGRFIYNSVHPVSFGIGSVLKKPVVINDQVIVREVLNATILLDHDVADGAPMRMERQDCIDRRDGMVETGLKPVSTNPFQPPPTSTSKSLDSKQPQSCHGIFEFVRALKTFSSRRMNEMNNTLGKKRWHLRSIYLMVSA